MTPVYTQFDMAENLRVIETPTFNIKLIREDPYGFWRIEFSKGKVPKVLSGLYTSARMAERDVVTYLNQTGKEVKQAVAS